MKTEEVVKIITAVHAKKPLEIASVMEDKSVGKFSPYTPELAGLLFVLGSPHHVVRVVPDHVQLFKEFNDWWILNSSHTSLLCEKFGLKDAAEYAFLSGVEFGKKA